MKKAFNHKDLSSEIFGSCSGITWDTNDHQHLWGRNYDLHRVRTSHVIFMPRQQTYYLSGNSVEHSLVVDSLVTAKYASLGMGTMFFQSTPIMYETINECGVMGGQFFYANCATYPEIARPNTQAIHPGFVVTHVLSQCKNNDEIVELFQHKITVTKQTVTGLVPYLHWVFTDKTGETIVIEPDQTDHVTIHRHTTGILTNAPGYQRQQNNLNKRFANLTRFPIANVPGEFSSRARFIRASLLKKYVLRGNNEAEGVTYLFRLLQNLAMPLGTVPVSQGYEYSIYTAVMCSKSLKYYWHSYRNLQTYCINLHDLIRETKIKLWPLNDEQPKYVDLTNQGETL